MSEETLDEVFNDYDREYDETPQIRICLICGEKYNIDEGCCLIEV